MDEIIIILNGSLKHKKAKVNFDIEKLESISRVYFSRLKNTELYDMTLNYTKEYDEEFYNILVNNKEYALSVLNIERDIERPRKDIASLSDVKKEFWYMFNELFNKNNEEYADVKKCDKETVDVGRYIFYIRLWNDI